MELHELASEAYAWFETARRATGDTETGPREDGEEYVRLREGAPEWLRDLVYAAHGDFLPDDWRYACIRSAVEWIADENDPDDSHDFADSEVDVYNAARFDWLASNLARQGYVDDAVAEMGGWSSDDGIAGMIGWGQYAEAQEVFSSVVSALESELEERCDRCGASTADGEGWDGLCGNCADEDYAAEYDLDQARDESQRLFPVDLAARLEWIYAQADKADSEERRATWTALAREVRGK